MIHQQLQKIKNNCSKMAEDQKPFFDNCRRLKWICGQCRRSKTILQQLQKIKNNFLTTAEDQKQFLTTAEDLKQCLNKTKMKDIAVVHNYFLMGCRHR